MVKITNNLYSMGSIFFIFLLLNIFFFFSFLEGVTPVTTAEELETAIIAANAGSETETDHDQFLDSISRTGQGPTT